MFWRSRLASRRFSGAGQISRLLLGLALATLLLVGCGRQAGSGTGSSAGSRDVAADDSAASDFSKAARVHPMFSLSMADLEEIAGDLPDEIQATILESPERFLELVSRILAEPPELVWLVDKEHPLGSDYAPERLVALDQYASRLDLSRDGHRLREVLLPDLFAMVEAARDEGIELLISSTYRSYAYQEELYDYWVGELGEEEASRVSARPGRSQHQLGTTIDFGCICDAFADTDAGRWLAENAWEFGFSLSYPDGLEAVTGYAYESWHFRYIGRSAARLEREFFDGVQQHLTEFFDTRWGTLFSALIVV